MKAVGSQSLRASERSISADDSRREGRAARAGDQTRNNYWHAHLQPRTSSTVLTDASRSCHDSSPRPSEASSAVAVTDDRGLRRSSVCGSRPPAFRCVSLPKQDRQTLSGFLPYQPDDSVAPQPRAHSPPPGRGLLIAPGQRKSCGAGRNRSTEIRRDRSRFVKPERRSAETEVGSGSVWILVGSGQFIKHQPMGACVFRKNEKIPISPWGLHPMLPKPLRNSQHGAVWSIAFLVGSHRSPSQRLR